MKVGRIMHINEKGQVVIPQEYRELFGITSEIPLNIYPHKTGIFIQPIGKVVPKVDSEDLYKKALESTVGAWGTKETNSENKKSKDSELKASSRRKAEW